jgi:hypothetical protein
MSIEAGRVYPSPRSSTGGRLGSGPAVLTSRASDDNSAFMIWKTLLVACLAIGCRPAGPPPENPNSLRKEEPSAAERVVQQQFDAYNRHDLDAFVAAHAPDVKVYRYPDSLMFEGRAVLRQKFAKLFAIRSAGSRHSGSSYYSWRLCHLAGDSDGDAGRQDEHGSLRVGGSRWSDHSDHDYQVGIGTTALRTSVAGSSSRNNLQAP